MHVPIACSFGSLFPNRCSMTRITVGHGAWDLTTIKPTFSTSNIFIGQTKNQRLCQSHGSFGKRSNDCILAWRTLLQSLVNVNRPSWVQFGFHGFTDPQSPLAIHHKVVWKVSCSFHFALWKQQERCPSPSPASVTSIEVSSRPPAPPTLQHHIQTGILF